MLNFDFEQNGTNVTLSYTFKLFNKSEEDNDTSP